MTMQVTENDITQTIEINKACCILDALHQNGYYLPAVCGGRGVCGKCAVRITRGAPAATDADTHYFTKNQLEDGYRLACITPAADGMLLTLDAHSAEQHFQVISAYEPQEPYECDTFEHSRPGRMTEALYGLAVDIGTTTVAFELIDLTNGKRVGSYAAVNRQRALGADVVTRIQQASQGKQDELHRLIVEDLRRGTEQILVSSHISPDQIQRVVIAGNTTMLHLLMNVSCASLGYFPFTPVFTHIKKDSFDAIAGPGLLHCEVTLLPGISAFVGADITAGMIFCGSRDKPRVLIDLGTNGEMALFSQERVIVTSTAAGPAFEAGNISRGIGSVPGAIAKVSYIREKNVYECETIGGFPAVGLCGTGVLDTAAQLVLHGRVDETGLLDDEYFDDGAPLIPARDIFFTQKDMREIQLAKSAVRSGLEVLLAAAGVSYGEVERVYLAGGFGFKMSLDSARVLGLLPEALCGKVTPVGNSALGGCTRVLLSRKAEADIVRIADIAEEINLSADPRFNDLFMEHMMFNT